MLSFSKYTLLNDKEIFREFHTSFRGLSLKDVRFFQKQYGLNAFRKDKKTWRNIFLRQFQSAFIYLLFFAGFLSFFLGEQLEALLIFLFIVVNVTLGFVQEYHSEKSLELLRRFVETRARVRRDGKETILESHELVAGDIVLVETGDLLSADVRFLETSNLFLDESVLTGESVGVSKHALPLKKAPGIISDAQNIGFSGTRVIEGKGIGVVVAIGKNTQMGEVTRLSGSIKHLGGFEERLKKLSMFILRLVLITLILVFLANLFLKGSSINMIELLVFSIALAVSVIPEALPLVTTISLSRGAVRLARHHVVVRRLSAIEDLGSIQILATDKTGTLTQNKLAVKHVFPLGIKEEEFFWYASLASSFLGEDERDPNNAFDVALWNTLSLSAKKKVRAVKRVSELPFDPERRRNSVLVHVEGRDELILRGVPEILLRFSNTLSQKTNKELFEWISHEGKSGFRVLALARKTVASQKKYTSKLEEDGLEFLGLCSFSDPLKKTTRAALRGAEELGVIVKILTGDSREVAGAIAKEVGLIEDPNNVITGEELQKLSDEKMHEAVREYSVFARVSPQEKYHILELLEEKYEVGFLGEGLNDAPALKIAHVGLVVDSASDISREAADVVLLDRSLSVIVDGIKEGREIFSNTMKYIEATLSSNFGNFYAVAIASLLIPFLPMLPVQILLLNLLSDFPMMAIAMDHVDAEEVQKPKRYDLREVVIFATVLGAVSTVFDFMFFGLFWSEGAKVLQTNWFIASILTELALIFSIRTKLPFWRARRPAFFLSVFSLFAALFTILLPFTSWGRNIFQFHVPRFNDIWLILFLVTVYFASTEIIKNVSVRFFKNRLT